MKADSAISVYLHVPFCRARCLYCDFYSSACSGRPPDAYVQLIEAEAARWGKALKRAGRTVDTLFVGGGTPTVLAPDQLRAVLSALHQHLPLRGQVEWTVECNPESLDAEKARLMVEAGVNRLSIGVQSFDDATLRALGRIHSATQALEALARARQAGIRNLNLDLLYGCPQQTLEGWLSTLQQALEWRPEHLSCYALTVEPDTPLAALISAGSLPPPDDDLQVEMAKATHDTLTRRGYAHYEISNFALPGHECRHNLGYWRGREYVGLGPGSVSCLGGVRWRSTRSAQGAVLEGEALEPHRRLRERAMLNLRTRQGLSREDLEALLGAEGTERWLERWGDLFERPSEGYNANYAVLSVRGMMLADEIVASLL